MPLADSSDEDERKQRLGDGPDSDSDDEELRAIPSGVVRKRKGWEGNGMEQEHAMQAMSSSSSKKNKGDAELIDSFQNKEVGQGYQHKTVMRQKGVGVVASKVLDMTGRDDMDDDNDDDSEEGKQQLMEELAKSFIESGALRDFKRSVTRLLKSGES
jgi:hypothetical protein